MAGRQKTEEREFSQALIPVEVPVPPMLEKALGYSGFARFVSFYWEPGGDEAYYDDGQRGGTGEWSGYLTYIQHESVMPGLESYDLGSSETEAVYVLILDREERRVYVAPRKEAKAFLAQQWPRLNDGMTYDEYSARVLASLKKVRQPDGRRVTLVSPPILFEEQREAYSSLQSWLRKQLLN